MIIATIGNNVQRKKVHLNPNTTLNQAIAETGLDFTLMQMHLDGEALDPEDLDRTFADHGITDLCFLIGVVNTKNAA